MENLERFSRESHYFFLPFSIFWWWATLTSRAKNCHCERSEAIASFTLRLLRYARNGISFRTTQAEEKFRFFRTGHDEVDTDRAFRYWFHRAEAMVRKPDRHGVWQAGLRLMVPQEVKKPEKEAPQAGGGGGAGPPQPQAKERVRGGWQFTLERTFFWH